MQNKSSFYVRFVNPIYHLKKETTKFAVSVRVFFDDAFHSSCDYCPQFLNSVTQTNNKLPSVSCSMVSYSLLSVQARPFFMFMYVKT
jgi:hypothetical protein